MTEQVLDTRIDGHHGVEDAGLRIGVELDQDLRFHGRIDSDRRWDIDYAGERRCLTDDLFCRQRVLDRSLRGGWADFFMARRIESLVAS